MNKLKILIFGESIRLNYVFENIKENYEIVAIFDNDSKKWGNIINGVSVFSPHKIKNYEFYKIVILPVYTNEIKEQLKSLGVEEEKILTYKELGYICKEEKIIKYNLKLEYKRNCVIFSPELTHTGGQHALETMAYEIKKLGYNVFFISQADGPLKERLIKNKVNVWIHRDLCINLDEEKKLVETSDLVVVNTALLHEIVLPLKKLNRKLIWWIHETKLKKFCDFSVFKRCYERFIKIYCVGELCKKEIDEYLGVKDYVKILRYGLKDYYNGHKNFNEKLNFFCIGYMNKIKGQDILIDAVSMLDEKYKNSINVYLLGRNFLSKEYEKKAIDNNIIILEEVPKEEMKKIYLKADVVVSASRRDTLPIVVTEAFMNEKPTIISDVIGHKKYVENFVNSILFKSENIQDLKEKIIWILENKSKAEKIGIKGRRIYLEYFSMDVFVKNIQLILKEN